MNTTLVLEAAVRSLLMASVVWIGIRALRVSHVVARKIAWCLVLAASLAMPFLMRWPLFHAGPSFVLPAASLATQPVTASRSNATPATQPAVIKHVTAAVPQARPMTAPTHAAAKPTNAAPAATSEQLGVSPLQLALGVKPSTRHTTSWSGADSDLQLRSLVVPVYLLVASMLLLRLLLGVAFAIRIWYRAERASPILEPRGSVRISSQIDSPVTIASGIVLPESCEEWSRSKQRIVLAHERSHVRQGDIYIQLIAQLYTAIFWFSPLGWLLQKELSDLGEAISDRAALEEAASRPSYAELLLEFAALPRRPIIAVAMARSSNIQRRIERILNERIFRSAFLSGRRHAVTAALLVPAGLVLATSLLHVQAAERAKAKTIAALTPPQNAKTWRPFKAAPAPHAVLTASAQTSPSQAAWPAPAAPAASAASWTAPPAAWVPPAPWAAPGLAALTRARLARLTALVQAAPAAPAAARTISSMPAPPALTLAAPVPPSVILASNQASIAAPQEMGDDQDDDDGSHFAVIDRDKGFSYSHNASWGNGGKADRIAKNIQGSFIWFERDGKSYVITDPEIVAKAKALFVAQGDIGQKQAALGKEQAELGRKQGLLAQLQAQAASQVQIPDISKAIAEVQRSVQTLSRESAQQSTEQKLNELEARLGQMDEQLARMHEQLAQAHEQAGRNADALGHQQDELGRQQDELGRRQDELGREQERAAHETGRKVRAIIDQSFNAGKARPVD